MEKKLIIIAILLLTSIMASSQITIGLDEEPMEGALLQLKNKTVTGQDTNSTKGLLLPRVELDPAGSTTGTVADKLVSSLKLVFPVGTVINADYHTGLMVYNMSTLSVTGGAPFAETKICPGVYVWDGSKWGRLMSKECQ